MFPRQIGSRVVRGGTRGLLALLALVVGVGGLATSGTALEPVPVCAGDCNRDGTVSIDELIQGINITLGSADLGECGALDTNGDGVITIDELIQAVNHALDPFAGDCLDERCPPDGIMLTPSAGRPGDPVTLAGVCYFIHSGASAQVYFDTTLVGEVTGDTAGNYELQFAVPGDAEPGPHEVRVAGAQSATFDVEPLAVCTPPLCAEGEVFACADEAHGCPGGCGTICATPTPQPTPSEAPIAVCTPPLCGEGEVFSCPAEANGCPGGCGTTCATPTAQPTPSETPIVVCTPPLCGEGEVFSCPAEANGCPGGCGTTCATPTAQPTPSETPIVVYTPPLCAEGEVFTCPAEANGCPGGCGTTCATPAPTATGGSTPFVDNVNGTVTDSVSGLTWEKKCEGCGGLHDVGSTLPLFASPVRSHSWPHCA
jgi:EF hand